MSTNLRRVIVVDIEATCWETRLEQAELPNEVIEIGACSLDLVTGEITDKISICVKPQFSTISPFCTMLTGWTQTAVDEGVNIKNALNIFTDHFKITKDTVWASYGAYDRIKLSSGSENGLGRLYAIDWNDNPFEIMRTHINIKTLMGLRFRLKKEMGLERALAHFNESLEGRHHSGADDAFNTAKVLRHVLA